MPTLYELLTDAQLQARNQQSIELSAALRRLDRIDAQHQPALVSSYWKAPPHVHPVPRPEGSRSGLTGAGMGGVPGDGMRGGPPASTAGARPGPNR